MYTLYRSNADDSWRYLLGTPGDRPLFAVGVNPHAATRTAPDRTVGLVATVARRCGYSGFVMLNIYPVRSRRVSELPAAAESLALSENLRAIRAEVAKYEKPVIWAAWGNDIERRAYLGDASRSLVEELSAFRPTWVHYGDLTVKGHPRHPSRLSHAWQFKEFVPEVRGTAA